ncbi:MAG: glycosyltransferase family 4 protein [Armatimonadia bacterium]
MLCLATEYPPARGYGLGRYAREHCAALVRHGVAVDVACNNWDSEVDAYREDGVSVHNAPLAVPFSGHTWVADVLQHNVVLLGRCLEMMRAAGGYNLILAHDWLAAAAAAALKALHRVPLVVAMHDTQRGKTAGQPDENEQYIARVEEWICEVADLVLANSHFIERELIQAYQVPPEKITVVGCGVRSEDFQTSADIEVFRTLFCARRERLVGFVGRLARVKGPDVLVQAVPAILSVCPDTQFVFAGDGSMRDGLLRQAREAGVAERVRLVGHLTGDVLAAFYHACDVIAIPSLYEPFGMVALEAMAAGRPVIASATGGLKETVLAGATGVAIPPRDPRALASAVVQLLMNPQAAASLGRQAQERIATEFRWDDVATRTVRAWEHLATADGQGVR